MVLKMEDKELIRRLVFSDAVVDVGGQVVKFLGCKQY